MTNTNQFDFQSWRAEYSLHLPFSSFLTLKVVLWISYWPSLLGTVLGQYRPSVFLVRTLPRTAKTSGRYSPNKDLALGQYVSFCIVLICFIVDSYFVIIYNNNILMFIICLLVVLTKPNTGHTNFERTRFCNLGTEETYLSSDCAIFRSVIKLRKHLVSVLRGFSNQNFEVSVVREVTALKRVQLQRDKWNSAGTKSAVRLREVSALESVRLERVDCIRPASAIWLVDFRYQPSQELSRVIISRTARSEKSNFTRVQLMAFDERNRSFVDVVESVDREYRSSFEENMSVKPIQAFSTKVPPRADRSI